VGGHANVDRASPLFLSPRFLSCTLLYSSLRSRPLKSSYWGSAVSSPRKVWGEAAAEIDFGAF